jgi:hypothetical protein
VRIIAESVTCSKVFSGSKVTMIIYRYCSIALFVHC